ncbi:DUF3179 domain-containing protein [Halorubrum sp. BOL3-1]|uniref:DUF3179 domain-containing protein n=1 Tax=Halorubrum sp. BOL3-1 TaxID=2497325 RepID=UPI001004DD97|nr:DUF3179 domain-containing protein [Halorubrum sp. BOL3-1]QAU11900.1 DUF3179 domain-containing protein [Halorubrum sp. BOL3-1]
MEFTRRRFVATAGLAALAGCASGANGGSEGSSTAAAGSNADGSGSGTDGAVPTAEETLTLSMTPDEIESLAISGGPPKDGIPSIDDPSFVDPDDAGFLDPGDPVFGVTLNGDTKAYPQKILAQHEVVNDRLGDLAVAVTYCPLTGTVQGFERGETTFGVSGRLINNNLVMYDRATEAWWPQIPATSIPGPWNSSPGTRSLREFRLVWTTWEQWRSFHPDTQVLSTDTGLAKNYGRDPYGSYNPLGGYYASENTLFEPLSDDSRFERKRVFMCARSAEGAVAFDKSSLLTERVMSGELNGTPTVAVADRRLDTGYIYLNPDERAVTTDGDTVLVGDTAYEPDALPLERLHTFDAMWFAWHGYYPDTNVYA